MNNYYTPSMTKERKIHNGTKNKKVTNKNP